MSVKNWDDYQHYKADKPAWIKLYRDITNDLKWIAMAEEGKLLFPYILLVAAETKNQIPDDAEVLAARLHFRTAFVRDGLSSLSNSGFLQFMHDDSETIVLEEKRREEKRRGDMRSARRSAAARVLEFLNERVERNYKPVDSNLDPIVARLKEGATEDECHMVIGRKALDWESDEKMNQFLRPATLFRKSKFWQYHGELGTNAGRVESA